MTDSRPTELTDKISDVIFEGLIACRPIELICERDDMPAADTVQGWLASPDRRYDPFRRMVSLGRDAALDTAFELQLELIDEWPADRINELEVLLEDIRHYTDWVLGESSGEKVVLDA